MGSQTAQASRLKGSARLGGYLRKLRSGYGYSLRRVEERARAEGGEIDNSQLSRYEKGVCYPSFDKLRILASVFNVSIQSFSDVVDLEVLEHLKPEGGDPQELIDLGLEALAAGETGQAFALFETATEILESSPDPHAAREEIAQARINQAAALTRLGKLALAEQELRNALRNPLAPRTRARALLALSNVHAEQGDLVLAEIEAERSHDLSEDERLSARALHSLGFIQAQLGKAASAIEKYRQASAHYETLGDGTEVARLKINIGTCYVSLGKHREGVRLLRAALDEVRALSNRRLEARCWTNLGEAYYRLSDTGRARQCFRQSNTLIGAGSQEHADLLFVNSFYDWKIAGGEDNPTREKIAFGRLKVLRSQVEKRFPEVEAFDAFVEGGHTHA